jgi:hypothetical protein
LDEVVRRFEEVTGHFDGDVGWSVFDVGFTYAKLAHGYTCFLVELYCCFNKVLYCYLQLIFAFGLRPIELNIVSVFLHKSTVIYNIFNIKEICMYYFVVDLPKTEIKYIFN